MFGMVAFIRKPTLTISTIVELLSSCMPPALRMQSAHHNVPLPQIGTTQEQFDHTFHFRIQAEVGFLVDCAVLSNGTISTYYP